MFILTQNYYKGDIMRNKNSEYFGFNEPNLLFQRKEINLI